MIIILDSTPLPTDSRLIEAASFAARRVSSDLYQVLKTRHGRHSDAGRLMDGIDLAGLMGEALTTHDLHLTEGELLGIDS